MKIGILTQPLYNNYGGLLQNYALQHILIKEGYEVETFDQPVNVFNFKEKVYGKLSPLLHIVHPSKYKRAVSKVERAETLKYTNKFICKYLHRTKKISDRKSFRAILDSNKYDALVVGSDQCWRPKYNRFHTAMFLDFANDRKDLKRIAYAASFGTDNWEYSQELTSLCAELVSHFDLVTVREDSAVDLCKRYLKTEAKHVLDPTMLLSKEDYVRLVEQENEPKSQGNLFYYILDPSEKNSVFIEWAAKQLSLESFKIMPEVTSRMCTKDDVKNRMEACIYPSVTAWLRSFMDAEMVICDSFHGCVFSIIFNKPFWVLGNKGRGNARFSSLLKLFNLEDRFVDARSQIDLEKKINWNSVNAILDEEREYSRTLLLDALKS